MNGAANGAKNMAGGGFLASSSIKFMSGNMNAGALSAGRFLMSIQALQPALLAAFTVVGLVALIVMLGVGIAKIFDFIKATKDIGEQIKDTWEKSTSEIQRSTDSLILENSKLEQQLANLQKRPASNEIVIFFNDAVVACDKLIGEMEKANDTWNELIKKQSIGFWGGLLSGQASTKVTDQFLTDQLRPVQKAVEDFNTAKLAAQAKQALDAANPNLKGEDRIKQLKADTDALNKVREEGVKKVTAAYSELQRQLSTVDGLLTKIQQLEDLRSKGKNFSERTPAQQKQYTASYDQENALVEQLKGQGYDISHQLTGGDYAANLTKLGAAWKQVGAEIQNVTVQNANADLTPRVNALRDALHGETIEAKAAREQMKTYEEQLKAIEAPIKGVGDKLREANEAVNFWKGKQADPATLKAAQPDITTKLDEAMNSKITATNEQRDAVNRLRQEYAAQYAEMSLYGNELAKTKADTELDNKLTELGIDLHSKLAKQFHTAADAIAMMTEQHKMLEEIANKTGEAERKHSQGIATLNQLYAAGKVSIHDYVTELNMLEKDYRNATDPLAKFNEKMKEQRNLAGMAGPQATVQKGVNELQTQTVDKFGHGLSGEQLADATRQLTLAEQQSEVQSKLESIYKSSAGAIRDLAAQQAALNIAMKNGYMTATQYNNAMIKNKADIANARLAAGQYSNVLKDLGNSVIGKVMGDFKSLGTSIADTMGRVATQAIDGVSNTLARLIVYGGSAKKAFIELGQQIAESIISALIKIGIQELISVTLGKAMAAAALATMAPMAASAAAMWAPAAVAASVATFGAADATGSAAYTASLTAGQATTVGMASAGFAADGAYVGYDHTFPGQPKGTDVYPYWLTKGEYVVNPESTRRHLPTLQAIQEGRTSSVPANVGAIGGSNLKVSVVHDGSTAIQVVQGASHDEVRVIAQNIARQTVQQEAPKVVAADLQNPNSHTAKALTRTTYAGRRRE